MNSDALRSGQPAWVSSLWKGAAVLGLAGATIFACLELTPENSVSESAVNMDLPAQIANFTGTEQEVSKSELEILPKDTQFAKKLYSDGSNNSINCQIVLAGGEKRSIHRPEICLPAQGWVIRSGNVVPVKLDDGRTLDVMKLSITRPYALPDGSIKDLQSYFYYWFVGKDTTTPHHAVRLLKSNLDLLLKNTNHRWAYVIVSAPVLAGFTPDGLNEAQTAQRATDFIAKIAPQIMQ